MCDESWTVGLRLRVVTVGVDQFRGCPTRECNIRPVLHQIAGLEWRPNHTGGDEFVEVASRVFRLCTWWDKLGDHAATNCDRDTFAGLDTPDVAPQVVLELADARGSHHLNYGHLWRHRRVTPFLADAAFGEKLANGRDQIDRDLAGANCCPRDLRDLSSGQTTLRCRARAAPVSTPPRKKRAAGTPALAVRARLPRAGKPSQLGLSLRSPSRRVRDARGRQTPGALMRRWSRGIYADHRGRTRRGNRRAGFPASVSFGDT